MDVVISDKDKIPLLVYVLLESQEATDFCPGY